MVTEIIDENVQGKLSKIYQNGHPNNSKKDSKQIGDSEGVSKTETIEELQKICGSIRKKFNINKTNPSILQ